MKIVKYFVFFCDLDKKYKFLIRILNSGSARERLEHSGVPGESGSDWKHLVAPESVWERLGVLMDYLNFHFFMKHKICLFVSKCVFPMLAVMLYPAIIIVTTPSRPSKWGRLHCQFLLAAFKSRSCKFQFPRPNIQLLIWNC